MAKYHVTIKRTIETIIIVNASSATQARRIVQEYGPIEAVSDFHTIDETMKANVVGVKRGDE